MTAASEWPLTAILFHSIDFHLIYYFLRCCRHRRPQIYGWKPHRRSQEPSSDNDVSLGPTISILLLLINAITSSYGWRHSYSHHLWILQSRLSCSCETHFKFWCAHRGSWRFISRVILQRNTMTMNHQYTPAVSLKCNNKDAISAGFIQCLTVFK